MVCYHDIVSVTPLSSALSQVERLQSDLSAQYLQYREQRDARQLLIWQINDLTRGSVEEEHPADGNSGGAATIPFHSIDIMIM